MQQVGARVEHALELGKVAASRALDHVASERVRAAGKSDQRDAPCECASDLAHRVEHVAQISARVRDGETRDRGLVTQRALETRSFTLREAQPEPHGIGHRENVGK